MSLNQICITIESSFGTVTFGYLFEFLDLNFINGFEGGYVNYLVSRNSSLLRKNGQDVRSAPNFVLVKETMAKTIELSLGLMLCLRIA